MVQLAGEEEHHDHHGAALGDVLTVITDDVEKVYFQNIWPGHVVEIELDAASNVKTTNSNILVAGRGRQRGIRRGSWTKERTHVCAWQRRTATTTIMTKMGRDAFWRLRFYCRLLRYARPTGDDHGQMACNNPSRWTS